MHYEDHLYLSFGFRNRLIFRFLRYAVLDAGGRIGLSVVGALQLQATVVGWRATRRAKDERLLLGDDERNALKTRHARSMVTVFMCCFGASVLRAAPALLGAGFCLSANDGNMICCSLASMILATNLCGWWIGKSLKLRKTD
jgi:hypothetical protein